MNIVYQAAKKDEAHQHETSSDLQIMFKICLRKFERFLFSMLLILQIIYQNCLNKISDKSTIFDQKVYYMNKKMFY